MAILCVNEGFFFIRLWTPLEKKRRPRRRELTARSDQSLSPSANCSRSRFVVAKLNFRTIYESLEFLHAAPKRLRQQLASVTSESDELRERKLASAWSAFFFSSKVRNKSHPLPHKGKDKSKLPLQTEAACLTAGQYLMQNSLHKIKIHISSAQLKRE